jgi:hypothetical protein
MPKVDIDAIPTTFYRTLHKELQIEPKSFELWINNEVASAARNIDR